MGSRCILLFENCIKSDFTLRTYNSCLRQFVKYYKLKDIASILKISDDDLQIMLEDYLFYMKKKVKVSSIRNFFAAVELFLMVNDRGKINFRKLHKMFPEDKNRSGKHAWTTKDIQIMLESTKSLRTKALIHLLASTGCRIGAVPDLKIKNLIDMPNNCMAVLFYESHKEEYWGFLTPEATQYMKFYLNKREKDGEQPDPDNPVFRENYSMGIAKPKQCSYQNIRWLVHRTIANTGIVRKKDGKRFDIQTNHGFRKRFNTLLKLNKNINPAITEKLLSHKVHLDDVYLTPTREDLFEEFKKAIPDLTINPAERQRQIIEKQRQEITELEKKQQKIERLEESVETIKELMIESCVDDDAKKGWEKILKQHLII